MAKDTGLTPEYLISLPEKPAEKWKYSPKKWIRHLYEKKQKRLYKKARSKEKWLKKTSVKMSE